MLFVQDILDARVIKTATGGKESCDKTPGRVDSHFMVSKRHEHIFSYIRGDQEN